MFLKMERLRRNSLDGNKNLAGKVTLIKYVLFSMPLFLMSIFKMPHSMCKEVTKL